MDKTNLSNRRKIYFIEKNFQTKFIMKFCTLVALGGLLTIGIIYLFAMKSTTVSIINSRVLVRSTADFLLPLLFQTVIIVMILIGLATITVTLFVSHKIAGPMHHFKKIVETLSEGDFSSNFSIRNADQLKALADVLNNMITKTKAQLSMLKDSFLSLKKQLDSFSENEVIEKSRPALSELKKIAERLDKIIQYFKS